jgi:hypothetical protein
LKKPEVSEEFSGSFAILLQDAIDFDREEREGNRVRALEYLRGVMTDTPSEPGRSSITTSELSDTVGVIMPGLMRIFAGSDNVVVYEPTKRGEEEQAKQASDYVAHIFEAECDGYKVLYEAFYDALTLRNGVVKYWWDDEETGGTETLHNLSQDQIAVLLGDESVRIVGHSEGDSAETLTVKIQRVERYGCLKIAAVPPEEFLISRRARCEDEAPLIGHRSLKTRSELVKQGFDKETVYELPTADRIEDDTTEQARGRLDSHLNLNVAEPLEYVECFECYTKHDIDGDGVAENVRVFAAGDSTSPVILEMDEWPDDPPFASFTPGIVPHNWQGRSVADDVMPLQRLSTVLMRQMLDNLYLSNRPQRAVDMGKIDNPDELLNPSVGGVIRCKGDPSSAVNDMALPFTAAASLEALRYVQQILQARTGASQASAVLDDGALVPQTATKSQIEHDAGFARVELIARNFAEIGMKRMFRAILKIIVRHQDRPRTIRLRNNWVDFDPRTWSAGLDVRVNVGLGTGTKERDLEMLRAIGMEQDKIIGTFGPTSPLMPMSVYMNTRRAMVSAAGLKDGDKYFPEVNDQEFAAYMEQQKQQPDPKLMVEMQKAEADIAVKREKAAADVEIAREKLAANTQLKREELAMEAELGAIEMATGERNDAAANLQRVQNG